MNIRITACCAAAMLACLLGASAQEPYQPAGAIATPKVEARWNYYRDHAQVTELLQELSAAFPNLIRVEDLGPSFEGREMWLATITSFDKGRESEKPGFYIDGGIHANEIQGVEVALYTCWYLCEMYEHSDFIRRLLDERVFYILPMLSPDSRDAHFYEPNSASSPRSGQVPVDDDRDGLVDEDGPEDLNGDGHIGRMRKRDPNGRWKEHDDYPGLLVRAEPDEEGGFIRLEREGIDNDGDGRINEDGDGYYDPNRDWAWGWQPGFIQGGALRYPFSLGENRLAADFIIAHPNIAGAQSYHNSGGWLLRGPGDPNDNYDYRDVQVYDLIGRKGEEMLPGYKYAVVHEDLYPVYGGEVDWIYKMRGALTFTNELWTSFNFFRQQDGGGWFGSVETQLKFDELLLFGDGSVEWEEFEHPLYGTIEIGGTKKTWGRQPPSFLLEEECHRNMAFTLYHADQMPQVQVASVEAAELRHGVTQITAVVRNKKLIPTRLDVDIEHGISRPDLVALEGEGFEVIAGFYSAEPFFEEPREQELNPQVMEIPRVPGNDVVYLRWLVTGRSPGAVSISSIKGGYDRREVE